ncbi:MAG: prepilin-type N-terminal cleavage/methylation domain-containing protein [Pontiella sp.]
MIKFRSRKGFTLLEVLVSMVILTLIVLMLSHLFRAGSTAMERSNDDALLDEAARLILDTLQTDISQALIRTNVPFRVETISVGDALYLVSTAVRRPSESNPRDTAPFLIRSMQRRGLVWSLNRRAIFEYPAGATGGNHNARKNLIQQSNYYRAEKVKMSSQAWEYTEPLEDTAGLTAQAVLTFMQFRINGDSNSNRSGLPLPTDLPRFIDVVIGLTAANDMRQAMRLYDSKSEDDALTHLAQYERVYTRRIFVPNRGTTRLEFK